MRRLTSPRPSRRCRCPPTASAGDLAARQGVATRSEQHRPGLSRGGVSFCSLFPSAQCAFQGKERMMKLEFDLDHTQIWQLHQLLRGLPNNVSFKMPMLEALKAPVADIVKDEQR